MRSVLFFADSPHRIGGAQKSLLAALTRIEAHGIWPLVVFPADGPYVERCREAGLRTRVLAAPPAYQVYGKGLFSRGPLGLSRTLVSEIAPYSMELARLAKAERCEAFHFNTPRGLVLAGLASVLSGLPSVLHLRGFPTLGKPVWLACQWLADTFLYVAKPMEAYLAPSRKSDGILVYNGIVPSEPIARDIAREALIARMNADGHAVDGTRPIVVSLNALVPFKGIHHLLASTRRIAERGLPVDLILAGTGTIGDGYEAWLRKQCDAAPLKGRVHFIGHTDDVLGLLRGADLTVLSSVVSETFEYDGVRVVLSGTEGLPRSILESLSVGTPVVATDGGGVREQLVEGVTGHIVPPSDPIAFADAMESALRSPSLAESSRIEGPKIISERFSLDSAARGLANGIETAIARHPRTSDRLVQKLRVLSQLKEPAAHG